MFRYDTNRALNQTPPMTGLAAAPNRPEENPFAVFDTASVLRGSIARAPHASGEPAPSVNYLYAERSSSGVPAGEYSPAGRTMHHNGAIAKKVSGATRDAAYVTGLTSPLLPLMEVDASAISDDDRRLNDRIAPYLRARGMDDLYERMLDRLESTCGLATVQGVLSILWGARLGMEKESLVALCGMKRDAVASVLSALENHLAGHGSRMTILRDELLAAIERRYLGSGVRQQKLHATIAEHFAAGALDERRIDEEPWQWLHADRLDRLCDCVVSVPMTMALILNERRAELFLYWQAIEGRCNLVSEYEYHLDQHESGASGGTERAEIFHALSDFYVESYRFDLAKSLLERCLNPAEKGNGGQRSGASQLDELLRRGGGDFGADLLSPRQPRASDVHPFLMQRSL